MEIVEILLCEGGGAVARTSKHIPVFAFDLLSLNSISIISCIALHCLYHIHAWYYLCAHTCIESRELLIAPQLFSLEESRRVVPKPFKGNSGFLLITYSVLTIKFIFRIISTRLTCTSIQPPLGVLSISIRGSTPDIQFIHIRVDPLLLI